MNPPIIVNLTANHASRYGGGLYVDQPIVPCGTKCFYQLQSTQLLLNPGNGTVLLSKNTASRAGLALFGGKSKQCAPLNVYHFQFLDPPGPSIISSNPKQVCMCTENYQLNYSRLLHSTSLFPGT